MPDHKKKGPLMPPDRTSDGGGRPPTVDYTLPVEIRDQWGLHVAPATVLQIGDRGAAKLRFEPRGGGLVYELWFDQDGKTPSDDRFFAGYDAEAYHKMLRLDKLARVDWSKPIEAVMGAGDEAVVLLADVKRFNDEGDTVGAIVTFGAGERGDRRYRMAVDAFGAPAPVRIRNAAPSVDWDRPMRTVAGRAVYLLARIDPPIADQTRVVRVAAGAGACERVVLYQEDGTPAHGHGEPTDALMNCDA